MKVSAPNGDVDTIATKEWLAKNPPSYAATFKNDFKTRYYDGPEVYKKMRDLAPEFPNISQVYELPEKTTGYQRKAQTMLGYQHGVLRHVRRQQPARRQHARSRPPTPTGRSS